MDLTLGQVGSEIFRDGVNWGRIVAFFSFGGALCVEAVRNGLLTAPGPLVRLTGEFTHRNLGTWITQNGGLSGFCKWWIERTDTGIWNFTCSIL